MADRFHNITEGSIPRQVVRLAWPAVLAMLLRTALTITDAFWVGHVGKAEMAAVISSMFVLWTFFSIFDIVWIGSVAVIARFYGARNFDLVGHSARQAIVLGSAAAVVMMIVGYITVRWLFHVMETAANVTDMGTMYLRIVFAVTIPLVLGELFSAMFRASGDTRTPLMISASATVFNIVLDPMLIFGVGPFPKLGVAGAALATAIAYLLAFTLYLIAIKRGRLTFKFSWPKYTGPDLRMMWQMIKIGSPLATAGVVFSVAYLFMNKIVSSFGTEANAALGIGNRCESISYLVCFGFSIAVSTLVGQNLGAGKPDRAAKSVWYALLYTGVFTAIISIAFLTIPRLIASGFVPEPEVIDIAASYLMILALSQSFMAIEIVMEGAFSGAGYTWPAMLVSVVGSVARVPLAYYFSFGLDAGVSGVFWSITLTTIVKGIVLLIWFSRGTWRHKEIHGGAAEASLA